MILSGMACANSENNKVTRANFDLAEKWTIEKQIQRTEYLWTVPHWLPGEDKFYYRHFDSTGFHYFLVDPSIRQKTAFFNDDNFLSQLNRETGHEITLQTLLLEDLALVDGSAVTFNFEGQDYIYELNTGNLEKFTKDVPETTDEVRDYSPDGNKYVVKRDCNLYLVSIGESGETETQITFDGEEYNCEFACQLGTGFQTIYCASAGLAKGGGFMACQSVGQSPADIGNIQMAATRRRYRTVFVMDL